jgi:hypothetical protein
MSELVHQTVQCAYCEHWYIAPCVSKEDAAKCGNTKAKQEKPKAKKK